VKAVLSFGVLRVLKRETRAQLSATRSNCRASGGLRRCYEPEVSIAAGSCSIRYASRRWSGLKVTIRGLEARVVKYIDEICPKLQTEALLEVETLRQRNIKYRQAGATQIVSAVGTEGSRRRVGERIRVKIRTRRDVRERIANFVEKPYAAAIVVIGRAALRAAAIYGIKHRERVAALMDKCSGQAPTAGDGVHNVVAVEVGLSFAEWQFVSDDALEGVRDVEV
jgi:hypothetical protein